MSRLLLDTHAFLWFALGDAARMPAATVDLIADPAREVYVSAASLWEIATKARLGKLGGVADIVARPMHYVSELGMTGLPITIEHAGRAGAWPVEHRDPFDRMLAAQGTLEDMALVSVDTALDLFEVQRLWPV